MANCGGNISDMEEPILESSVTRTGTGPEVSDALQGLYCLLMVNVVLLVGVVKGLIIFPITTVVIGIGNTAVILALWPVHIVWTCYSIVRMRLLGPVLKTGVFVGVVFLLLIWPVPSILGSFLYGACYAFVRPYYYICESERPLFCFLCGGIWSTISESFSEVKIFSIKCFGAYFSTMEKYRNLEPPDGKPYEIRLFQLVGAIFMGVVGIIIDVPMVTIMAIFKSPLMMLKTCASVCVEIQRNCWCFIGCGWAIIILVIFFCPVAIAGSFLYGFFLGGYAAVITYEESSIIMGLRYIVASLAAFDELMLLGRERSCFPKLTYRYSDEQQPEDGSHPIERENIINIL